MSSFLLKFIDTFKKAGMCPEKEKCLENMLLVMDGEASEEQKEYVTEHLHKCMPCSKVNEVEKALRALLKQTCKSSAPSDLVNSIKSKLNQNTPL